MTTNMMSPYAPVRYRGVPWWEYSRELARTGWVTPEGGIGGQLYEKIDEEFIGPMMRLTIQTYNAEGKSDVIGQGLAQLFETPHWMVMAAQFEQCGREIFDLNEQLVASFHETDLGNCTLESWQPPYDAFFLRFGKQEDIRLDFIDEDNQFEYLDGAFVAVSPYDPGNPIKRLRLGLTTVRKDGSGMMGCGYFLDFKPDTHDMLVSDAIEKALASRQEELNPSPGASENEKVFAEIRKARYAEAATLLRLGARLVFNSLFYIESIESTQERAPGRDVPEKLKQQWQSAPPLKQGKLKSKLTAEGFTVVRLLGHNMPPDETPGLESEPGTTLRTHWRRAHWRQQAYGEGMKLHKRIRIPKVLVNRDQLDGELPGRIYKA